MLSNWTYLIHFFCKYNFVRKLAPMPKSISQVDVVDFLENLANMLSSMIFIFDNTPVSTEVLSHSFDMVFGQNACDIFSCSVSIFLSGDLFGSCKSLNGLERIRVVSLSEKALKVRKSCNKISLYCCSDRKAIPYCSFQSEGFILFHQYYIISELFCRFHSHGPLL